MHSATDLAQSTEQQLRITIAFMALAWFFILLRIWTRTYVISNFGWDDSIMILAGMTFTVYCASTLYIESNGGGTHVTGLDQLQSLTKWVVVSEATYIITVMIVKISLAIFFLRIMVKRCHFILVYVTVGVNIISSASAFFYCFFRCGPSLEKYAMNQLINECASRDLDLFMAYQQAAFSTFTDVVFLLLPVPILWYANMDKRSKFSVGFILCLAALGCICSGIRFRYIDGLTQTDDFFWNIVNISIWSTIEAGACIVAGCLATLRPLMKLALRQAVESSAVSHISRSLRSSHRSNNEHSKVQSVSRRSRRDVALSEIDQSYFSSERKASLPNLVTKPSYTEYVVRPDSAVTPFTSDIGLRGRTSTDPILGRTESGATDMPLWEKEKEKEKENQSRQPVRVSWGFHRRHTSEESVPARPKSTPILQAPYKEADDAV
ncbi:uncharacterized protein ALTATR162_LOCUS1182 [Alternaria atra]|uniref:Rhodopsin domain-containing protein n=1 Tax=Alternaria atra TaxID=119953 RepID=A0A8J2MX81_9PLEO|nr:uncharacterized protein ALTATR162_LOCUS1182 [Alternaria atra]CAG5142597.1 unnamed protein product [Alternaria atra]